MLAAFISDERWLRCSIGKDSMHLSSQIVGAITAGEIEKSLLAICKVRYHTVKSRCESKQWLSVQKHC